MKSVLTLSLFLITLLVLTSPQPNTTIAIQNELETFYGYLTLSECSPPQPIVAGTVSPTQITPVDAFEAVQLADQLTFWGPVYQGLTILTQENQLLNGSGYNQVVYFNSSLNKLSGREVILTSFNEAGNIILTYAIVEVDSANQAQIDVQYNLTTDFNNEILTQNQQCLQSSTLQMASIGNSSFLVICPNYNILFAFDISDPSLSLSYSIQDVYSLTSLASNPDILLPDAVFSSDAWQVALLINGQSQLLLCSFNQSEASCSTFSEDLSWLQIVGARAWGLDPSIEQQQLLSILQLYPTLQDLSFPGTIFSIYRIQQYVYVQTMANQQVYLIVLEGELLLVNVSVPGQVVLYTEQKIVVQSSNNSLWMVNLVLPYFTINSDNQNSFNIRYTCQNSIYSANYSIIWTNYNYPSAVVLPLSDGQLTTDQGVFTYNLNQAFQSIGPAFEVFVQNQSPIDITLLSPPTIPITHNLVALLEISMVSKLQAHFYFLSNRGEFILITSRDSTHRIIAKYPCSFSNTPSAQKRGQNYIISNEKGESCICQPFLKNCSLIKSIKPYQQPSKTNNSVKQQIYTRLLDKQLINVYNNGSVALETLSGEVLASISSECPFNSTDVVFFPRTIKDDLVLVLCESAASVTQYLLRENEFLFNREIPLYGFVNRPNGTFKAGKNFVYIEVDVDQNFDLPPSVNQYKDCCVLRLDPNAFTVSTIVEVVQAQALVLVQTLADTDVVSYNMSGVSQSSPFLKIYIPSVWVSVSNPPICIQNYPCPPVAYNYSLTFVSLIYNFASSFGQIITFDLESSALSISSPTLELTLNQVNGSGPEYSGTEPFNLSWACGPIMSFWVSQNLENSTEKNLYSLTTDSIVINNKLISLQEPALQIIDLESVLLPGSSLNPLLMVVSSNSIDLYIKFTNIWLIPLPKIPLPVSDCIYYLFAQPNSSSVQFASTCYNLRIPTPILTIVYPSSPTNSLNYSFGELQFPKQLRNIISFARPGAQPLVLGLEEGPSKSITGILAYCQKQCRELSTSVEIEFLVDFDAVQAENILIVVALDSKSLIFWLNPPPPSSATPIPPTKVLNYRTNIGQPCDSIKIVQVPSPGEIALLIGCIGYYFLLRVDAAEETMQIMSQYAKFSNCDSVNPTKPKWVLEQGGLSLLVAECLQNQETVKTQQFQTIASSNSSIVTAYMQVYTLTGPNCFNIYYPARILPLAVSHALGTFTLYQINNTLKLLYQTMSGQLIDAFIDFQPATQLTLTHLSKQPIQCNLSLKIRNPYYHLQLPVEVIPQNKPPNTNITLTLLIVFIITNLSTLVFLVCWLAFKRENFRRTRPEGHLQKKDSLTQNSSQMGTSSIRQAVSSRSSANKALRRVTQIQLFQPRYQPS